MASTSVSVKRPLIPLTYVIALVPVAAALNIVGGAINSALRLPTFLDMIGTAVVAITLGPWWGALVGILTNVGTAVIRNPVSLPFAFCNVAGALVWGYGVRWGLGKSFGRYLGLSVIVAFVVSAVAAPIYIFVFGGATGHFADMMTAAFIGMGRQLWTAVFSSNIVVSLADKIISSFVALAILAALPRNLTSHIEIIEQVNMKTIILITLGIVIGVAAIFVAVYMGM